jgi:hypothetical protein
MGYAILGVISPENTDGRIWPVLSDPASGDSWLVRREDLDGASLMSAPVTSVSVSEVTAGGSTRLLQDRNIQAWLYVTDSRVIFACEKYDKGSRYLGVGGVGAAVALTATAVSKARAKARSRGKVLAGQVRYQWLKEIWAAPKAGLGSSERLRLGCATRDDKHGWRPYLLEVALPERCPALDVAQDIVRRAAAFKLRWLDGISDDSAAALRKLADAPPLHPPERGRLAGYRLPCYQAVTKGSAVPARYRQETSTSQASGSHA